MRFTYDDYAYTFALGFVTVVFGTVIGILIGFYVSGY